MMGSSGTHTKWHNRPGSIGISETNEARRVREILAAVKPLAAEYYRLTGKPLGVTGEVALPRNCSGLILLRLAQKDSTPSARLKRVSSASKFKGRAYGEDAKPNQRLGTIKQGAPCDGVLLAALRWTKA
jgi:hypothetical protein